MVTVAMSDGLSDEESTQGRPLTPCKLVSRSLLLDWLAEAESVLNQCIDDDSPIQLRWIICGLTNPRQHMTLDIATERRIGEVAALLTQRAASAMSSA